MLTLLKTIMERTAQFVSETTGTPDAELEAGIEDVLEGAMALALEARAAERKEVALDAAVADREAFPRLHRAHNFVRDLVSFQLPPALRQMFDRMQSVPEPSFIEESRLALARLAASGEGRGNRALARFILFEAVRFNLLLRTWAQRPELHEVGVDDSSIDETALTEVEWLVSQAQHLLDGDPIRPLHLLVAAGAARLDARFELAKEELVTLGLDLRERYRRRADLERVLADADATDAVLVTNSAGRWLNEQRLEIEQLAADHPLLFPRGAADPKARNAIDQRHRRRVRSLSAAGGISALAREGRASPFTRSEPALVDLIRNEEDAR